MAFLANLALLTARLSPASAAPSAAPAALAMSGDPSEPPNWPHGSFAFASGAGSTYKVEGVAITFSGGDDWTGHFYQKDSYGPAGASC